MPAGRRYATFQLPSKSVTSAEGLTLFSSGLEPTTYRCKRLLLSKVKVVPNGPDE